MSNTNGWGKQGWEQFLANRDELLSAFDSAKRKNAGRTVRTEHGRAAEADVRRWLGEFLPKRYGVTAGFIVSQGLNAAEQLVHFDVIIYDQLESPVLWIEGNNDLSAEGSSKAIPAEYVLCVIEVKSTFSKRSVVESLSKLRQLEPLLRSVDEDLEIYKRYLPRAFCSLVLFFEIGVAEAKHFEALELIAAEGEMRGFMGGIILRGKTHTSKASGRIYRAYISRSLPKYEGIAEQYCHVHGLLSRISSTRVLYSNGEMDTYGVLMWGEHCFAQFAHDIVAMCQGRYNFERLSSWHGIGFESEIQ